jgi:hypothetical protein
MKSSKRTKIRLQQRQLREKKKKVFIEKKFLRHQKLMLRIYLQTQV